MIPPEIPTRLEIAVVKVELKLRSAFCPAVIVCCAGVSVQFGCAAGIMLTVAVHIEGVDPAIPLTVKL